MTKKDKRQPKLRFPGFTDDWEQRKFSDCYKMSSGYAFKMSDYCDEGVGLINGESIQHGIINDDNLNHLPESFIQQYPEFLLKENDIVVGLNRPITNGNLKIARIPSKYNDSLLYQRAGKIVYKTDCDKNFTYVLLSQEILKHTLVEAVGSDQPFISTSKLDGWKIMMPSNMEEQVKIGEYFQNLDHLITLHQRKCDQLELLKKGLMQKLFSQEVRFKTDDGSEFPKWEEKKLGEIAVRIIRKNSNNVTDIPLTISSVDGLIDQRNFFNKIVASKDMSGYYLLKKGEFAYNKSYSKGYDFGSIKRLNLYNEGALSTLYICFALNENENSDFYQTYFDSLVWYPELQKICAEGARNHGLLNVPTNDFFEMKLRVPKSIQEQQKIADCLSSMDQLIEKQKKTVLAWKELKKGLLQQMFI